MRMLKLKVPQKVEVCLKNRYVRPVKSSDLMTPLTEEGSRWTEGNKRRLKATDGTLGGQGRGWAQDRLNPNQVGGPRSQTQRMRHIERR